MATPILSCAFDSSAGGLVPCKIGGPVVLAPGDTVKADGAKSVLETIDQFAGSQTFTKASCAVPMTTPQVSASMWARSTTTPVPDDIAFSIDLTQPDGTTTIQLPLYVYVNGDDGLLYFNGMNNVMDYKLTAFNPTAWHHYAVSAVRTGLVELYVDGVKVVSTAGDPDLWLSMDASFLALHSGSSPLTGHFDDVRLYNTTITAADVTHDMNTPASSDSSGSVVPANATTSDAEYLKLGGPVLPDKTIIDLLNTSFANDVYNLGYGAAVIKNWGQVGDTVVAAKKRHSAALYTESLQDSEYRYWKS